MDHQNLTAFIPWFTIICTSLIILIGPRKRRWPKIIGGIFWLIGAILGLFSDTGFWWGWIIVALTGLGMIFNPGIIDAFLVSLFGPIKHR
jgi:disulfide bond formation protein DsbB